MSLYKTVSKVSGNPEIYAAFAHNSEGPFYYRICGSEKGHNIYSANSNTSLIKVSHLHVVREYVIRSMITITSQKNQVSAHGLFNPVLR